MSPGKTDQPQRPRVGPTKPGSPAGSAWPNAVGAAAVLTVLLCLCLVSYTRIALGDAEPRRSDDATLPASIADTGADPARFAPRRASDEDPSLPRLATEVAGSTPEFGSASPRGGAWSARHRRTRAP